MTRFLAKTLLLVIFMLGSVLSVEKSEPEDFVQDDFNRRIAIKSLPAPVLSSLRWPGRPELT